MTRQNIFGALLIAAALVTAPAAGAQALKIGFVNFGRLLEESPQAKAAQAALEAEFMPRQRDVAAQQKSLQEKADKLQKEAAVMSEADRVRTEREMRDLELNVNRRFKELQEDLNLRRNEEVGKMQRALLQEVQAYARTNGYQLVLSEGVLFAAEGIDITPQLVAAIKAKAPAAATPPKP
ncbi:MAG TPA: OmpH family outer membrane protein [Steroidobacteraceae bacterium]|nr:OmpH family outer membrane protein [Steroidobacteraceae bacterium]